MILDENLIPASVLIPIFVHDKNSNSYKWKTESNLIQIPSESSLLFTKRTETVEHHKGQISFPGGRFDDSDQNLLETALRETEEEVGIHRSHIQIIGHLPTMPTVKSNFKVTPYIGLIHSDPKLNLNTHEIDSAFFVPFSFLLDPKNSVLETYSMNGIQYKIKAYHFQDHRIWGVTGRILQMFLENIT